MLLLGASTAIAVGYALPANAAEAVETVVVTGSRIPTKDYTSNSPLATVQGEDIRSMGTNTVESYLNTLPQFTASITKTNNNPTGGGAAYASLRNLGTSRTLVLIDGRRPISVDGSTVDLSVIPPSMIERVETITGGASAVYGSDALAGVVNFILKRDFEGIQANVHEGISGHGDGEETHGDLTVGGNFGGDKGNATLTINYDHRVSIGQGARDFSHFAQACYTTGCILNGSGTTPDGTATSFSAGASPSQALIDAYFTAHGGLPAGTATATQLGFNPDGTLFFTSSTNLTSPVTNYHGPFTEYDPSVYSYNFNPTNLLEGPLKRFSFLGSAHYSFAPELEVYTEAMFTNYTSMNQLAPLPGSFTIPLSSPALTTNDLRTLYPGGVYPVGGTIRVARRLNEQGTRNYLFDTNEYQFITGARGVLPGLVDGTSYNYDVYASYGRYYGDVFHTGFASTQRLTNAATGCATAISGPPGTACTALNVFGAGKLTQANVDYIAAPFYDNSLSTMLDIQATISTAEAFSLWAGPVGMSAGVEYRDISYQDIPDIILQIGDVNAANQATTLKGSYHVLEGFGEVKVPLLADMPLIKYLGVEAAVRVSSYSTGINATTLKAGGEYSPTDGIKFRAMYQHALRAPNVGELFTQAAGNFPSFAGKDPCNPTSTARTGANGATVLAMCQTQAPAVNFTTFADNYPPFTQLYSVGGGNPALKPETENNFTIGAVLTAPESFGMLAGFTATIDYYNMVLRGVISSVDAPTSLNRCYDPTFNPGITVSAAAALTSSYCQAIHRDPAQGGVSSIVQPTGFVTTTNANIASWKVSGIDFDFSYNLELSDLGADESWGSISMHDALGYLDRFKIQLLPGEAFTNIAGTIGSGSPGNSIATHTAMPNWKNALILNWNIGEFGVGYRWNLIGAVDHTYPGVADGTGPAGQLPIRTVPIVTYSHIDGRWDITDQIRLSAGIDNLFDQQPPRYSAGSQDTTDPSTYDVIGRYFYAGVTVKY